MRILFGLVDTSERFCSLVGHHSVTKIFTLPRVSLLRQKKSHTTILVPVADPREVTEVILSFPSGSTRSHCVSQQL